MNYKDLSKGFLKPFGKCVSLLGVWRDSFSCQLKLKESAVRIISRLLLLMSDCQKLNLSCRKNAEK